MAECLFNWTNRPSSGGRFRYVWRSFQNGACSGSFDQRTTPEIKGIVARIAPDRTQDTVTGEQYYSVRVKIHQDEMIRLPENVVLFSGLLVDTFVKIEDRTILSYLINPFAEQLNKAFREE